jgi:acetyl esterase
MLGVMAGDSIDPELGAYVAELRRNPGPPNAELGVLALRAAQAKRVAARPRGPSVSSVSDFALDVPHPLPVRLYRPGVEPCPLVVYLHGGGWTVGDLESHDSTCRRLAVAAGCAVLAVDYRRAPEHPWPAAVDDAVTALRWALSDTSTGSTVSDMSMGSTVSDTSMGWTAIGVAGDSSGGNLAALACLRLRSDGDKLPAMQGLFYPNTDLTLSSPSVLEKATGWGLDADAVRWFISQWVPDESMRADPRVSPLFEPVLAGLPPALVVTAEHDPLRDEGDAYAERLSSSGVPVIHRRERGLIHGFLGLDAVSPAAAAASERLFADLAALLHPRSSSHPSRSVRIGSTMAEATSVESRHIPESEGDLL